MFLHASTQVSSKVYINASRKHYGAWLKKTNLYWKPRLEQKKHNLGTLPVWVLKADNLSDKIIMSIKGGFNVVLDMEVFWEKKKEQVLKYSSQSNK